ncbi:Flavodoxin [Lactobacillus pasteurii DSM 23907 = CRBIP 24.76]|uniref:Flavodoxin n=1 Tax=Lactobacillus pasteurii DSM 23907 = CRBIP 24.76 TaxID=1423790 RepID=I7IYY3_9LACO|nr:Flavodoxin [Lactobacillus pasteurii DSM 23907 = CRBIP 24.76]
MKIFTIITLVLGLLVACANTSTSSGYAKSSRTVKVNKAKKTKKGSSKRTKTKKKKKVTNKKGNNRVLIIYFSMSGTTRAAAKYIQSQTGADVFELKAKDPYPSDYDGYVKRGDQERRNNIHPAIKDKIPNFDKYQTILIGYPTWWSQPPMIIDTLFDDYNFSGKTIIPFTTSMSTPMSASQTKINQLAKADGAKTKTGLRITANDSRVDSWLKSNNLEK